MSKTLQKKDVFKQIILDGMCEVLNKEMGYNLKCSNDVNNINTKHKGEAFLKFYLNSIFKNYYKIDDDSIEQGITDNCGDKGIDFIALDENKVYILQAKYNDFNDKEIEDFIKIPENIKSNYYNNTANANLKAFISEIKKLKKPEYNLIYVTSVSISEETKKFYEEKSNEYNNLQLSIIAFSDLKAEHDSVMSMGENAPDEIVFELGQEDHRELMTIESNPTVIITQKGSKLKMLYQRKDCRERLFNLNIRQWLGKNSVNKEMINTIIKEPNKFFYYNNGITAICESFSLSQDHTKLFCKKFQVVNGAQTLTTIAKQPDSVDLSAVKVLIKIIEADKYTSGDKASSLAHNIVKNNNSQTIIKSIDFRSNDNVQVSIEAKVKDRKLKYPLDYPMKNEIAYKRKRRINDNRLKTISMENVAKTYYSTFINPNDICLSSKKLWDTSDKGYYYDIFGIDGEKIDTIPDEKFYKLFGCYYIFCYINEKLKNVNKNESIAFYFKYHILWSMYNLFKVRYSEEDITNKIFKRIVEKGYYVNPNFGEPKERVFNSYYEKVQRIITSEVIRKQKESERQGENIAYRTLLVSKDFTETLKYRIDEITPDELLELILDN